ncbi:PP2C family protein-serine/threonine phosphatase [Flaviaesturariibacter terrae]
MTELQYGLTDTGLLRSNNEDAFLALPLRDGRRLLCVIDGVGGYEGGEVAAALARDVLAAAAGANQLAGIDDLRAAFVRVQETILAAKEKEPRLAQMACVLTAVLTDEAHGQFQYAHVGDTRLYLFRDGSLVKISHDHSFVGLLEDSGRLSEAEAMEHPKRNEIDRALGFPGPFDPGSYIETGTSPFLPGDGLLLCSDGLSDLLSRAAMTEILLRPDDLRAKAAALVAAANKAGGKDNITVVLALHPGRRGPGKPVGSPRTLASQSVEIREEAPPRPAATTATVAKRSPWLWIIGGILLLALLAWGLLRRPASEPAGPVNDPLQASFADLLLRTRDTLRLPADSVLALPDSLFIGHDSLLLLGSRSTVLRPGGKHSVLQVAPTVRLLALTRLELHDADIRISSSNIGALRFDSVRLLRVSIGVGPSLYFRDTVLSGVLYSAVKKGGTRHE